MDKGTLKLSDEVYETLRRTVRSEAILSKAIAFTRNDHCEHTNFPPIGGKDSPSAPFYVHLNPWISSFNQPAIDPTDEIDFSIYEKREFHSSPPDQDERRKLKINIRPLEAAGDGFIRSVDCGHYLVLSDCGWMDLAANGKLAEAISWLDKIREKITTYSENVYSLAGLIGGFDQLVKDIKRAAIIAACEYLSKHSPLDDSMFQSCAGLILDEADKEKIRDWEGFCSRIELSCWSGRETPMILDISVVNPTDDLAAYDLSSQLQAVFKLLVAVCVIKASPPVVSENQFWRWSRVFHSIYIKELGKTFQLTLKKEGGTNRLVFIEEKG